MGSLRQTVRRLLTASLPRERFFTHARGGPAGGRSAAFSLTFDDGPHPVHTPEVLAALERWGQRGTFFVVGREAERFPELVRRIEDAGHAVGNHSYCHSEPQATTASVFLADVARADRLLASVLRASPRWVRPPKGEVTALKLCGLWAAGHSVALWNVDPRDYQMRSSDEAGRWSADYRPEAGDVVLLHDRLPWAAQIVDALGRAGVFSSLRSVPLDEWLPAVKS